MTTSNQDYADVLPHLSPVWTHGTDIIASRAEGAYVYDLAGRAYLDFTCGIGVTNTGHCHPRVVAAIREQAGLLLHGQANIILHQPMLELVRALLPIVPSTIDGFFFSNSGAEAVEGAIKLARHATGRSNVIVFQGSFHGRTASTMALTTSKTVYRAGYQPLPSGVFIAPYPYAYRYGWSEEQTTQWCLDELDFVLMSQTAPQETAAILIEPVLGEGGYVVPPKAFLTGLRELCDRHGILLIADEIQSGFGRTGRWFAVEHFDLRPDILTVAKGLGSGLPISGVFSRLELMQKWVPGSHGGTFGGNAVAAAGAVATIAAIRDEHMLENAQERGAQLTAGLRALQQKYPVIGDVRGLGLMIGTEFRDGGRKPDKKTAKAAARACHERGLMLLTCGPWDNVIRWIPPLIVSESQIAESLNIFEAALKEAAAS
ncbi:4-aminobutyrate aminotransferase [Longilinea arvoryzae]|uniref:(S)-3-amino-2-methylpropionate transaminase n=1 Tax=Longilinea arvoryzae TaxID=360412 RepID=A0A0S7BPQ3_9CHLR|nr:aminotransferase class III-fold pyridoxal phosphate-dependent enzyme [Longilinea arvoryzae]GAP15818.1 4-aminobutyrate aminotransferase [Longilinea arvoryzae]